MTGAEAPRWANATSSYEIRSTWQRATCESTVRPR